uniref:Uncharacterized protein n=1 Tax=Vitis vinifera TaxID=29760 RepID=F6I694_VITVI
MEEETKLFLLSKAPHFKCQTCGYFTLSCWE